jgi:hypothetical protein
VVDFPIYVIVYYKANQAAIKEQQDNGISLSAADELAEPERRTEEFGFLFRVIN